MHMRVLCLTLFFIYDSGLSENNKQPSKNLVTALVYLKGNKYGQALKIPAFLLTPIIIVPKEYNINDQSVSSDENLEENSAVLKNNKLNDTETNEENNDIEVGLRQALNRGNDGKTDVSKNKNTNVTKKINHNRTVDNSAIKDMTPDNKTTTPGTITEALQNVTELTSTESTGLYPTAVYDDQVVNTLTITDGPPNSFLLPPLLHEEWKNFTVTANINVTQENKTESTENITMSPSVNETDSTIKGPYPAALYHNKEIDQVSITTNSYTNESPLPPPKDDRWRNFSSLGEMFSASNEFRPLAGLYYDGFLHRPLPMNPGFVPYNQYFLY